MNITAEQAKKLTIAANIAQGRQIIEKVETIILPVIEESIRAAANQAMHETQISLRRLLNPVDFPYTGKAKAYIANAVRYHGFTAQWELDFILNIKW